MPERLVYNRAKLTALCDSDLDRRSLAEENMKCVNKSYKDQLQRPDFVQKHVGIIGGKGRCVLSVRKWKFDAAFYRVEIALICKVLFTI
jgi:hypothetical protein